MSIILDILLKYSGYSLLAPYLTTFSINLFFIFLFAISLLLILLFKFKFRKKNFKIFKISAICVAISIIVLAVNTIRFVNKKNSLLSIYGNYIPKDNHFVHSVKDYDSLSLLKKCITKENSQAIFKLKAQNYQGTVEIRKLPAIQIGALSERELIIYISKVTPSPFSLICFGDSNKNEIKKIIFVTKNINKAFITPNEQIKRLNFIFNKIITKILKSDKVFEDKITLISKTINLVISTQYIY